MAAGADTTAIGPVRRLKHHFDTLDQQFDASTLGMWVFLLTEIMFFGGMFLGYTVYRALHPTALAEASHTLYVSLGTANTAILIISSFTMALAVRAARLGQHNALRLFLIVTILLGCLFLSIKGYEYYQEALEHHVPGPSFTFTGTEPRLSEIFFFLYFAMTGIHAVHMIIGLGLMTVLLGMTSKDRFGPAWHTPVEMTGLYWHFVDIIWIFLYPLLYLAGDKL